MFFPCKSCKILTHLFFPWPCWFVFPLYWPSWFIFLPVLTWFICVSPCIDLVGLFSPLLTWFISFSPCSDLVGLFFSLFWPGQFVFFRVLTWFIYVSSCRCCKELNQWDLLLEYATSKGNTNPHLVLESAWRVPNWSVMKDALAQVRTGGWGH